jgi:glycosyltransferase involved in cell wall biosynthesis
VQPKVSIITSCYTSERLSDIQHLIDSMAVQTSKNFETLIVAERSLDLKNKIEIYVAEKHLFGVKVLFNEGPHGISAARNLAINQAEGDILAFVDDDAVLNDHWVEEILKTFQEDNTVVGVTGPISPLWEKASMAWFPPELYWIFSCTANDPPQKVEVRNGYGTNISFDRQSLINCGLFNPELGVKGRSKNGWQEPGAEETILSIRIKEITGKRIIFNPCVRVQHKVYSYRISIGFIIKRAFWEGYAKSLLKSKQNKSKATVNVLTIEYTLLRRILFYRIPHDFKQLFKHPKISIRRLGVVSLVLVCVAAGYAKHKISA